MRSRPLDLVDILVYLIVLGTFSQLFPAVISESFLLSLLTAVLLKVILEAVLWLKKLMLERFRSDRRVASRLLSAFTLVLILPGSKFLVLEVVAFVFGDAVQLGGFFLVTLLIVVLMLARGLVRRLFSPSGQVATDEP